MAKTYILEHVMCSVTVTKNQQLKLLKKDHLVTFRNLSQKVNSPNYRDQIKMPSVLQMNCTARPKE